MELLHNHWRGQPVRVISNDRLLRAARGESVDATPVWFMRQAGRSLPEYRAVRGIGSILDVIKQPELAAEITMQPVRRYGVDGAVLYSDIVVPAHAIGFGVDIAPGVGPVIANPIRSASDLSRLRPYEPEVDAPYVSHAIRSLVAELDVPLIGFAGAPFTVASYLVEGRPSRTYEHTKSLMYGNENLWHSLMDRLADMAIASLLSQVAAGASAIQLFDSWVGVFSARDYTRYVMPHSAKVLGAMAASGVPRIHFGVGTGELLTLMGEAGADVVGVDWRVPLDVASQRVGPHRALQGNLDPVVVTCDWSVVEAHTREVVRLGATHSGGHIFNLGHGVTPDLDPEVLTRIVALVHDPVGFVA